MSRMTMTPSCSAGPTRARTSLSKIARSIGASTTHRAVRSGPAQSVDESLGLPMAEGSLRAKALAPVAASARAGHLGVGSGFVDEDQPMRLGPHLRLSFSLPPLAPLGYVGPIVFAGLKAFF